MTPEEVITPEAIVDVGGKADTVDHEEADVEAD
jgi:hypothetical protein